MEEIITCKGCNNTFYKHLLYMDGLCIKCAKKQTVTHVRKVLQPCCKCGKPTLSEGLFEIDNKKLCGTCVGKYFEEDFKKSKQKEIKKEERSGKERRIILE